MFSATLNGTDCIFSGTNVDVGITPAVVEVVVVVAVVVVVVVSGSGISTYNLSDTLLEDNNVIAPERQRIH